ncbi:MAG: hypothetical protein V1800_02885 [Candidatus Latescibacterota bacterium]
MPRSSHEERATQKKILLDFLSKALEDQVCQLEKIVRTRAGLDKSDMIPPSEPIREMQEGTPEMVFSMIDTPRIEATLKEPAALLDETEGLGAYPATPTLAEIFVSQGLMSEAIGVLKQILEQEPEREDLRHRLHDLQRTRAL